MSATPFVTEPAPVAATAGPSAGTPPFAETGPLQPLAHDGALPAPLSVEATGVSRTVLSDLVLRLLLRDQTATVDQLARHAALAPVVVDALLAELRLQRAVAVRRRGDFDGDMSVELTDGGRLRAEQAMARCQYVGPAPVSLQAYRLQVERQAAAAPVTRERLQACLADLVINPALVAPLGAAINSGQPLYLYGAAGSGKSYLAEHLATLTTGHIVVPFAIEVEGEIVVLFDPTVHERLAVPATRAESRTESRTESRADLRDTPRRDLRGESRRDARWTTCRRPVIRVGGEFAVAMMDLAWDPVTRYYKAPVQMKANNGLLIVDDLGRQREPVEALLNRWIVPLERKVDGLRLQSGIGFEIPFALKTVFSSNLSPADLGDPAFLRRLGYKLPIGSLSERDYLRVLQQACRRFDVACSSDGALHLVRQLHGQSGVPTMAAYPGALVAKIADRARFEGVSAVLSPDMVDWAWQVEFATAFKRK